MRPGVRWIEGWDERLDKWSSEDAVEILEMGVGYLLVLDLYTADCRSQGMVGLCVLI